MNLRILLVVFCFAPSLLFAQARMLDSLRTVANTSENDTARVNALNELAHRTWSSNAGSALDLLNKAVAESNRMKNPERVYWLAKVNDQLGNYYVQQGDAVKALDHYTFSVSCWDTLLMQGQNEKHPYYEQQKATVTGNMALAHQMQGNYAAALDCYERTKEIDIKTGNTRGLIIRLSNIGVVYTQLYRYTEAEKNLTRALVMADSMQNAGAQQDVHLALSNLYKASGRYEAALREYTLYASLKDSLYNIEHERDLARIEAGYAYDRRTDSTRVAQEKKDLADAAARQLDDETLKQTRLVLLAVAGGFILIGVLAFFTFRGYREKQKANAEITRQKEIIGQKDKDAADSVSYAQKIQRALFASDDLLGKHLKEYFILFRPKDRVSGDFYYAAVKGQSLYLAVCDSAGYGVPGAFVSLLNIAYLNEAIHEQKLTSVEKIFNHVRRRLAETVSGGGQQHGMDGVLVRFNLWADKHVLEYAAAFSTPFVVSNGTGTSLPADKMPVGQSDTTNGFTLNKTEVAAGSCLYLFTDGITGQSGAGKDKKMNQNTLEEKLVAVSSLAMQEQKTELEKFFDERKGSQEQADDVLVVGIRIQS